jgi:hypothetical protein
MEAWSRDAGLQLLQLSVWHVLKLLLQAFFVWSHVFGRAALQALAETEVCEPEPIVQE